MAIFNLGSINIDTVFGMKNLPKPGETILAESVNQGLGGKGANMSLALAHSGAAVFHIGAVGEDGQELIGLLADAGVDTSAVKTVAAPTGRANIYVDDAAENSIVVVPGANHLIGQEQIEASFSNAVAGDWLVTQQETTMGSEAALLAKSKGMNVAYAAAPFELAAVEKMLELTDILVVNEVEASELLVSLPDYERHLASVALVVTKGLRGASYRLGSTTHVVPAFDVEAKDTTGAGDTYLGYFIGELDRSTSIPTCMRIAAAAAAVQVTRSGSSEAIPSRQEVTNFLTLVS